MDTDKHRWGRPMDDARTDGLDNVGTIIAVPSPGGEGQGTAVELSPAAGPHWPAPNLNPNLNLARLRFLEITIKIGKKPFLLNSMAVEGQGEGELALSLIRFLCRCSRSALAHVFRTLASISFANFRAICVSKICVYLCLSAVRSPL